MIDMNLNSVQQVIEGCPILKVFENDDELRKKYYKDWQKYLKYKKIVYEKIDSESLECGFISEANWILRSKSSGCEELGVSIKIGDICFIDFGQAYINEVGYQHFGLVMNICKNKALVIPMTSNSVQYTNALDEDNPYGKENLMRIGLISGLNKPSVLFMNDLKFINTSRVIDVKAHIKVKSPLFRLIQQRMLKIMFFQQSTL